MMELRIETLNDQTAFSPGDVVEGIAGWRVEKLKSASLRLLWRTEGKGTQDVGLVEEITFDDPQLTDARTFRLTLPAGPYSYDGTLVAIIWALELEAGKEIERMDLTVKPADFVA